MAKNYINNTDFEIWVSGYNVSGLYEFELFSAFELLFTSIFKSYAFKVEEEDARQDCMLLLLRTVRNFTPDKGRAFNYFTTVILNNLRLLYTKDQKHYSRLEELLLDTQED